MALTNPAMYLQPSHIGRERGRGGGGGEEGRECVRVYLSGLFEDFMLERPHLISTFFEL